ncbi:MAG: peptidyl-tRNA hydrolase Pth2 [Nanoarchaeota archaeon]|nr:peptidyl-tRNA hydrolase Pth2 [Nanoarchaeota archaeon]MBU4300706.1 peptidyl-tRNA hydrolase Pth2 [Nanoarchaeota archaeon]MBU4451781.1 peptidyl-tRNA hydrolase Pth2 [Nanoarchaeota archaeon]MCG2723490.1 peptidyl-tRNA hydrolase Pth2 [archaeon]
MKQAIIIRADLKMTKGKLAAQAAHASLESYKKADFDSAESWESEGQKKVILKVSGEKELIDVFMTAKKAKIPAALIRDAGKTQLEPGTATCVGIGPEDDDKIDAVAGKLKLL